MATLFTEQLLDGFSYNSTYGAYTYGISPSPFMLILGESYTVKWDENEYECIGQDMSALVQGAVAIGNLSSFGGTGNNEPFALAVADGNVLFLSTGTEVSHSVAISGDVIFQETTLEFVESGSEYGTTIEGFQLIIGQSYKILWDETEYICKATEGEWEGTPVTFIQSDEIPFWIMNFDSKALIGTSNSEASHIVAIYGTSADTSDETGEDTGETDASGISIVLYDRTGEPVIYEGIKTITTDTPDAEQGATFTYGVAVENAEYEPDFSNGNQKVTLEKGQLMKGFTMVKPENLLPEYIKKNVEVAGVIGEFAGDEMEKTVDLAMADGDQVIEADEDTVLTKVTVKKPKTMVSENIKKDVEIGGIVGTFTGNGVEKTVELNMADGDQEIETDNDTVLNKVIVKKPSTLLPENIVKGINIGGIIGEFETTGEKLYSTEDPEWIDKVVFWDCDGSIVSMFTVEEAKMLSELPTPPTHDGLTFQGWNFKLEEIQSTTDVLDVGAIYVPSDGKTHVKIEVTSTTASNRTVPTYFSQTVSNGVTIDWGDGTVETIEGTGVVTISHVYATTGEYEVTYDVADGCEMIMGGESSSYRFIWKNNTSVKVKEIYIGERVVGIGNYAFYSSTAQNIQLLTIPDGVKTIGDYTFKSLYNLKCVLIPKTVESIGSYSFGYMCYNTGEEAVLSLPNSVLTISGYLVECSTILRVILPNELESISNLMFYNAYAMRKVILKDKITSIGANAFECCRNLKTLELPNNVKTISGYAFQESGIESLAIPEGVTTINDYTFRYAYSLRELILPTTLIAINQYAFNNCRSLRRIIIPENVETVGSSWLEYCTAIQSIVVKSNKITSSNRISYTSQATREVVFTQVEPTSSLNYFDLTFSGKIYVPDESVDAYKALFTSTNSKAKVRPLREYIGEKYWE